ncbi:alpha/beta hydrolase [Microbacterium sp. A93]|uniref:alpha/beta hydrolase n=1 Tax=Microbacterium sp. A93 TaxID=3450716 RepID=UPI003F4419CF
MALDNASVSFLEMAAAAAGPDAPPAWEQTPQQAREGASAMTPMFGEGPAMHSTENIELTGWDGGRFEIRIHRPVAEPEAVFVYLHGGGWVVSDIDSFDTLGRMLAHQSGATVVLVNYRKAPENPFPAALEDAWTALNWTADRLGELAHGKAPLYVGGDSAGGNLAAVVALRSKDQGKPKIARQFLIYPVADADFTRPSYLEAENQTLLPKEFMAWFWDHYVPDHDQRSNPEASPLQAEDLSGVAPAFLVTAAHDVLRDEGEAYADRLREAGVDVESHRWPGQMHGFFSMVNVLPASAEVMKLIAEAVRTPATQAQEA